MNENYRLQLDQFIAASKKALQEGKRSEARDLALRAAELDPDCEESWLILAALASPQASLAYLQNALRINPNSERAHLGMKWAMERIQKDSRINQNQGSETGNLSVPGISPPLTHSNPFTNEIGNNIPPLPTQKMDLEPVDVLRRNMQVSTIGNNQVAQDISPKSREGKKKSTRLLLWLAVPLAAVILAFIGFVGFFLLSYNVADASSAAAAQIPTSLLFKPSLTPTASVTPTPTNTPLPTSTSTPTPIRTETPVILPTWTYAPVIVYVDPPAGVDESERWIDVDLSNQMVYAYVGDQMVNSFLVSTGTSAHPTVTGRYHIYVKYVYDDMAGPGYYLPDVPYVMYFYSGYSLHGTYWHHNFGTPMSHGCVNMYTPDAEWLFNWASVGTLVNVHY
jgi:lipoprotein-anchoring transpeptidase ErfK/SrfK